MSVTLYGPKGYFNTYAMLDTGSACSLLATDVAKNPGLDGPMESVLLNGIQKSSKTLTKRDDVQASQFNDFGTRFDVHRVLVVDRLNVPERRVNFRELQEKWPHIADLELDEVSVTPVTLLVASAVPELIVPLETRCGPKGSPVGVRTKLGWTVTSRVCLVILNTVNLFTRFILQPLTKCFIKQLKLGGGPRTLDVDMTVMCSDLSKLKRC